MRKAVRVFAKVVAVFAELTFLIVFSLSCWLYFYTADLPDVRTLKAFAPKSPSEVRVQRAGTSVSFLAVSPNDINDNVRGAIFAANGDPVPGVLKSVCIGLTSRRPKGRNYSIELAQGLDYGPRRPLSRTLAELRAAIQIERRYTPGEILTVYANRMETGADAPGIGAAANYYFHKRAKDLSVPEAALLAGLEQRPLYLSPLTHPERALTRRNLVIDRMARSGSIPLGMAEQAKSTPLSLSLDLAGN